MSSLNTSMMVTSMFIGTLKRTKRWGRGSITIAWGVTSYFVYDRVTLIVLTKNRFTSSTVLDLLLLQRTFSDGHYSNIIRDMISRYFKCNGDHIARHSDSFDKKTVSFSLTIPVPLLCYSNCQWLYSILQWTFSYGSYSSIVRDLIPS